MHSPPRPRAILFAAFALTLALISWPAPAQVRTPGAALEPLRFSASTPFASIYVEPAQPGKSNVAYWGFDWRTHDFGVGAGGAGIRLFFDGGARRSAALAIPILSRAYLRLSLLFDYLPTQRVPFVLYATQSGFLSTHVFAIGEGTLGATDPGDLRMAMPFFGDLTAFERVATHEMAHQFTVQKVRDAALDADTGNPLALIPLWFIEGLAEWASLGGIDAETDGLLRDLIVNPDPMRGYALPDFFDEQARGYFGIYKLGQARVTFLAETFGVPRLLAILERAPQLTVSASSWFGADAEDEASGPRSFAEHVARVLGSSQEALEARYRTWMKRRYFRDFFETAHDAADFEALRTLEGEPDALATSDDGSLLLYRSHEQGTGRGRLYLEHLRDPDSRVLVARDGRPGVETLHPVSRRVATIRKERLAFVARDGARDVLWVRRFQVTRADEERRDRFTIELEDAERFDVPGIVEILSPTLSPDATRLAFVGIADDSFRDIYVLDLDGARHGELQRLTDDVACEGDLLWDGARLLFTSDASPSGKPNLFALDMRTQARTPLALWNAQMSSPLMVPSDAAEHPHDIAFIALPEGGRGRAELWLLRGNSVRRLTELPFAIAEIVPGERGGFLALAFWRGRSHVFRIWPSHFFDETHAPFTELPEPLTPLSAEIEAERLELPEGLPGYAPLSRENWRLEAGVGASVGGLSAGSASLMVTDLLRDHLVILDLAIYGRIELTEALAWYVDQSRRLIWGAGIFHTFEARRDKTFPEVENYFIERHFGASGFVRYPLDRFRFLESSLEVRGVDRADFTDESGELDSAWRALNRGIEPEILTSFQFGLDTLVFDPGCGPIEGSALLASLSAGVLPNRSFGFLRLQLDASHRFRLMGRMHLLLRGALGATTGGRFSPQFFLASIGNLEGFRFGDVRLIGDNFGVTNLRLNLPLDFVLQSPLFSSVSAVGGFDFGSVFDEWGEAWQRRSLSAMLGIDAALGNLVLQFHFGRLIDTGNGLKRKSWVFNLNLAFFTF
ncbi:MAG: hypothetical protein LBM75_03315 [Myxococcales bacterium]|jgi:hypothetical protein|nr:hypothetical protein [Myxococcales bacterium]